MKMPKISAKVERKTPKSKMRKNMVNKIENN